MERLIKSIRDSLSSGNYIAAITLAVTLPDICGNIEWPNCKKSEKRYVRWCKKNLESTYCVKVEEPNFLVLKMGVPCPQGADGEYELKFLESSCLYQLRCALLHSGRSELSECRQDKRIYDEFEFVNNSKMRWCVKMDPKTNKTTACFDTQLFCENMCEAVERWLKDCPTNLGLRIQ